MRARRRQIGRGALLNTALGTYKTLRMAARHAGNLKPDNFFRRMTVVPDFMKKRMYKYH